MGKCARYAGDSGYIDKARVKDFLTDLMVDKTTGEARGIWSAPRAPMRVALDYPLAHSAPLDPDGNGPSRSIYSY